MPDQSLDRCPFCNSPLERLDPLTKRCPDPAGRGCGFAWRKNTAGKIYAVTEPAAERQARQFFEIMAGDLV